MKHFIASMVIAITLMSAQAVLAYNVPVPMGDDDRLARLDIAIPMMWESEYRSPNVAQYSSSCSPVSPCSDLYADGLMPQQDAPSLDTQRTATAMVAN